ncbi:MAG: cytochrome c biogenesis protein CcsA [Bacteroidetes bacterium]|nr:cytochrome c biogenesis protein CcsA [Bacteroidota bacterium]MBK7388002.1 cytochrome c biogenesis protein CcsA [Bacteroidota bacterium]MBK8413457.1 cytochrome c biogenesis protein CcsA [Bacteroidota bacterium]MBK8876764.1 cytochrome c biogenesis protein CcsA [Bacteroidota bacterium]MBK9424953.1 cytochrome c biogenesis protein CcsA [Bacteroidota bacterium]
MKNIWWKAVCIILLMYTVTMGFLGDVPAMAILNESIRNLYFHVTMWFAMMILLMVNLYNSIRYLGDPVLRTDEIAEESSRMAMVLGILGLLTGMVWAKYTWGAWWVNDVQLNGAAGTMLVYAAYFILRNSIEDEQKRGRIAAVYSIFAFAMMIVFIIILPRMGDSLHPGKGGNPGFSSYDLDHRLRLVFYPAVIGWTLLGVWIMNIRLRIRNINKSLES